MAKKQSGLGKGLEALFADNAQDEGRIENIRISEIEPNREQPRKQFDEAALQDLADSIRQHGVLQPILVRPEIDGSYRIVAGERRWRAARMAGLMEIPVMVKELDDETAAQIALIENIQREDLNPMEEAEAIRQLMESFALSQEQAAQRLGKSRSDVANKLRLLGLPEKIRGYVAEGRISSGHARALLAVTDEEAREKAVEDILAGKLTVRDVEKLSARKPKADKPGKCMIPGNGEAAYREVELALKEELHRKVKVVHGEKESGKLEIEFFSQEELKQIAEALAQVLK